MPSEVTNNGSAKKMAGYFFVVFFTLIVIIAASIYILKPRPQNVPVDLASACPRTYQNDLLEFQYPCSWLLTSDSDDEGVRNLVFTNFYQEGKSFKEYFWIKDATDGFSDSHSEKPSVCESGEFFSERTMTIPSFDGQELEACYHEEHGGQTLTIHSDRFETGYISISSEGGLGSITSSLRVK